MQDWSRRWRLLCWLRWLRWLRWSRSGLGMRGSWRALWLSLLCLLRGLLARWRLRGLYNVHRGLNKMRLNVDGYMANFGHAIFGRVLGVLLQDTFAFVRLRPVLFEKTLVNPFVS